MEQRLAEIKVRSFIDISHELRYRAKVGTNGNLILMHSVGSIPHGAEIDVPLNYADYYLSLIHIYTSQLITETGRQVFLRHFGNGLQSLTGSVA